MLSLSSLKINLYNALMGGASGAAMSLDFLSGTLDPRITFSRGTAATRVNASGFIETVGTTTPRFDYDPVTLAPKGLLIEEARTNLLTYSDDWTNAAWADAAPTSTVTVAANNTTAPDGTSAADKLTAATGGTNAMARQAKTLVASTTYTGSVFVKASTSTQSRLLLRDTTAGTNFADATLTWAAGVPTVAGGATGTWAIIPFGNGWYRVTGTGTSGATASPLVTFSIFPDTSAGTNAIFAYGAQLEAGSNATSYIPTVASQVTRTADQCSIVAPNFAPWYNQSSGTLLVEYDYGTAASDLGVNNRYAVIVSDGSSNNRNAIYNQSGFAASGLTTSGGSTQAAPGAGTTIAANTPLKVAYAYAVNDFAISLNGGAAVTDTSGAVPTNLNQMLVGSALTNAAFLNGHIRSIAYYNTRLPNAQLQSLTA